MKKLFTLAAVVCMATLTQAISLGWETAESAEWRNDCSSFTLVYTTTTGSSAKAVMDVAKILANESIEGYSTVTNENLSAFFTSDTEGWILNLANATDNDGNVNSGTYYLFFSGKDSADKALAYGTSFDAATAPWSVVDGQNPTLDKLAVTFTDVSSAVPEPTVLALLALGVAGVALRRRRMA